MCGTMVHVMVFSTNKVKSNIGKNNGKIATYHETVNMAIAYAISRPFVGQHTPRSCMLASVATILHETQKVRSEQGDGRMGDGRES